LIVKNNSKLAMDDLYTEDSPRWILNLKVISEFNLMLLKELKEGERLTYSDMGHLLMTGALGRSDCNRRRFTV
jgi:hypothetical protein